MPPTKIIKVPFPEFLDVITALATSPGGIDSKIEITLQTAIGLYSLGKVIPEEPIRGYYKEVIRKWITQLQNETMDI